MTVSELLNRISAQELTEWMAYDKVEPFGPAREDFRAGMITAPLINLWTAKGATKAKAVDWIVNTDPTEQQQSDEAMKMLLFAVTVKAGGNYPEQP